MGKKRKSDATSLDEVDRTLYSTFCSAANSLSQLYTHSMSQQKVSFQAGERHGLERVYNWILRQQEDGSRVTTSDVIAYLENGLEISPDDPPVPFQQHYQTAMHFTGPGIPVSGPGSAGLGLRSGHPDQQAKNSVFSNALSSPVRRSLQNYHLGGQGGNYPNNIIPSGNGNRSSENGNTPSSNDSSMDMHADSPGHESSY